MEGWRKPLRVRRGSVVINVTVQFLILHSYYIYVHIVYAFMFVYYCCLLLSMLSSFTSPNQLARLGSSRVPVHLTNIQLCCSAHYCVFLLQFLFFLTLLFTTPTELSSSLLCCQSRYFFAFCIFFELPKALSDSKQRRKSYY